MNTEGRTHIYAVAFDWNGGVTLETREISRFTAKQVHLTQPIAYRKFFPLDRVEQVRKPSDFSPLNAGVWFTREDALRAAHEYVQSRRDKAQSELVKCKELDAKLSEIAKRVTP